MHRTLIFTAAAAALALTIANPVPAQTAEATRSPDTPTATTQPADTPARNYSAASGIGDLMAQLEAQGYIKVTIRRTLLGRYRVEAENAAHVREIVMHQRTGEILRDVLLQVKAQGDGSGSGPVNPSATGENRSGVSVNVGGSGGVSVDTGSGGVSAGGGVSVDTGLSLGN